jgi:ornithine--oxo-acid transaminase
VTFERRMTTSYSARNYHPLPVVIAEAEGVWVTDVDGRRYLDALAGYSALNFGHRHPRLIAAAEAQMRRVTLTSRAFDHDGLEAFCADVARLTGTAAVLPMNTGAEAVETAIKVSRRWGYRVKGVPPDEATIVTAEGNFHGRTTTIVSFSTDPDARDGFGPFTPGFRTVPYGDADAIADAMDETTVAVLVEPIQGEAGVVIPPEGYLRAVRRCTEDRGILLVADEIQSGLGRAGATLACDREDVRPDIVVLGKALGGGILPVPATAAPPEVMDVFTPGSHGSTFGGNPLACAVAREVVALLETGTYQERSRTLGARLERGLRDLSDERITAVRAVGLWAGIDLVDGLPARRVCEALLDEGVLSKDTHERTLRLSPPLVITEEEVDLIVDALARSLARIDAP